MPVPLLGHLAGQVALARRRYFTGRPGVRRRLTRPVISVGNLSVGGRGKTPTVQRLAAWLRDEGWRPAILSRGYGRADVADGAVVVSDGVRLHADLARAGDEPLMLARALPGVAVVVCTDRYLAGRLAETHLGATVHLLDDGFQHLGLERTVDLLIVDPEDLRAPHVLPSGRLREPLDAVRAADALLWTAESDPQEVAARLGVACAFRLVREPGPLVAGVPGDEAPGRGTRVVALCGVARPQAFVDSLTADGFDVAATLAFPDHHRYDASDLARIRATAASTGAAGVVTTEKDWMRLLPHRPLGVALAWRPLAVRIEPFDAFAGWLRARLAGRPAGSEEPAA